MKSFLEKQLKTIHTKESYISITVGFLFVLFVSVFAYNFFSKKIHTNKFSKLGQVVGEQKSAAIQETYTVLKGDDLWKIAVKVYGNGFAWVRIAKANNLANLNTIHAGNTLIIPR